MAVVKLTPAPSLHQHSFRLVDQWAQNMLFDIQGAITHAVIREGVTVRTKFMHQFEPLNETDLTVPHPAGPVTVVTGPPTLALHQLHVHCNGTDIAIVNVTADAVAEQRVALGNTTYNNATCVVNDGAVVNIPNPNHKVTVPPPPTMPDDGSAYDMYVVHTYTQLFISVCVCLPLTSCCLWWVGGGPRRVNSTTCVVPVGPYSFFQQLVWTWGVCELVVPKHTGLVITCEDLARGDIPPHVDRVPPLPGSMCQLCDTAAACVAPFLSHCTLTATHNHTQLRRTGSK